MRYDFNYFSSLTAIFFFWEQHPALLYGLSFYLGAILALKPHPAAILPVLLIWHPLFIPQTHNNRNDQYRLLMALLTLLCSAAYCIGTITFPQLGPEGEAEGVAHFVIDNIKKRHKHYGIQYQYVGTVKAFYDGNTIIAKNIPATLFFSNRAKLPPANTNYHIAGKLKELETGRYILSHLKHKEWLPIDGSFSAAAWRSDAKQKVTDYIQGKIYDRDSSDFLAGIATGEFDNKILQGELARFGLQHIMAISGFHFAIIASMVGALLYSLLPQKMAAGALITILTGYFIFLGGGAPSIWRAWLCSAIAIGGVIFEKRSESLNSLGVALMTMMIIDPLMVDNLGFQFSFSVTGAILLLCPLADRLLQIPFPKRSLSQALKMPLCDQHGYCWLSWCRQAIALTIAVNSIAIPLILYHFNSFPLMGLLYNLFFPFMASLSMIFLLIATALDPICPLAGGGIHTLNEIWTRFLLGYTSNIPRALDFTLSSDSFPVTLLSLFLCALFIMGVLYRHFLLIEGEESEEWNFA